MATDVTDNEARSRYEIRVDGELAGQAAYKRDGAVFVFTHTEVDPRFRGRGVATELVRGALDDVRARQLSAKPVCPLVREFIDEHPEYVDLVPGNE